MRKLLFCMICCVPMTVFGAVDVSDCEVIGHQKGNMTEKDCVTVASCNKDFAQFPQDLEVCLSGAKTPVECKSYISEQNANIEKNNLVYRCPVTDVRLKYKLKPKTHMLRDLVYNDGRSMNQDEMAKDTQYVYLFHADVGIIGFIDRHRFSIIGAPEKYGLNMVIFDE